VFLQIAEWLEATAPGVLVRESLWAFPIVVGLHIIGLTLSIGVLMWFDLRLLGIAMRGCPVSRVYRRLMPFFASGFVVMFVTGGLLLSGFATAAYGNVYFRVKMAAIALAGVNALAYHGFTERRIADWDSAPRPPRAVRMAGLASLLLWTTAVLAGRMMSYTMF